MRNHLVDLVRRRYVGLLIAGLVFSAHRTWSQEDIPSSSHGVQPLVNPAAEVVAPRSDLPPAVPGELEIVAPNLQHATPSPAGTIGMSSSDGNRSTSITPGTCPQGYDYTYSGPFPHLQHKWRTQMLPNLQARYWGYPEYFHERPFGSINSQVGQAMVSNGMRDRMVLYDYDFGYDVEAGRLKPRGIQQLAKLAGRFSCAGYPIVIQSTDDEATNAERKSNVLDELARMGMELDPEMVVVAEPRARGLDAWDAPPIFYNLVEQTRLRGNVGIETSGLTDIGYGSSPTGSADFGGYGGAQQ